VDDILAAVFLVVAGASARQPFDVYNVATDDYVTVTEIAGFACEVMNLPPGTVRFEYTGGDRGWKGDVPQVLFNVDKIKSLGWRARRTSREAIRASLEAMLNECR
jgi:UDP-glucose 4-epimerase